MLSEYLNKTQELTRKNEPFALAVVVRREEPSSGKVGDKAVINRHGEIIGWIGGGCVRGIVVHEAVEAMRSGRARLVRIGKNTGKVNAKGLIEYTMTCQSEGTVEVFIEPVLPPPQLVVVGKSAIARALVRLARVSGYHVTAMATDARIDTFDKPDMLITQLNWSQVSTSPDASIVVATQGEQDEEALAKALGQSFLYLGFVASRKKRDAVFQHLLDTGFSREQVDMIHAPAGIDIQAKAPEEVAVSILAEIIQERHKSPDRIRLFQTDEPLKENERKPLYYINPVCGIPVDVNSPKHVVLYENEPVYFCCDGCKEKFELDPGAYMKKSRGLSDAADK